MSELNNQNINVLKSYETKVDLLKNCLNTGYVKDILTFLELDYRDALLIKIFFVVLGTCIPKIRPIG